jgi:hypothetical protein
VLEVTNENFARLLKGLTIAVGNRKNRILIYQFLAAEIRALHYSYGVGDGASYKRALTFLEECERFTLRSLVRKSAERHVEVAADHANRVLLRALKKPQCLTCNGRRSGSKRFRHSTKKMRSPGDTDYFLSLLGRGVLTFCQGSDTIFGVVTRDRFIAAL